VTGEDLSKLRDENRQLCSEVKRLERLLAEKDAAFERLSEEESRCRELVELAADAVFKGDHEGRITAANRSATLLTGYSCEELLGRELGTLFSSQEPGNHPLRYDLLKAGQVVQYERMLTRRDGSTVSIWMNSRMMPDGTYHTFIRNNTERKKLEEQLLTLVRDLEAYSYTVSHDLKNPLSAILGSLEILKSSAGFQPDERCCELFLLIESSAEGMLALIENLLALARTGKADRPEQATDTGAVVAGVLENLAPQLEASGMTVEMGGLPQLHLPSVLVGQVFHNLIVNSLLYAAVPGTTISIVATEEESRVRLSFSDRGGRYQRAGASEDFRYALSRGTGA